MIPLIDAFRDRSTLEPGTMRRYRTSLTIEELDPFIKGKHSLWAFVSNPFGHHGNRRGDRFTLHRGFTIKGKLDQRPDGLYVELRPDNWIYVIIGVLAAGIFFLFLFVEDLRINGEPATPMDRAIHLPIALLTLAIILGVNLLVIRMWLSKIERDMKLERVPN